MPGANLRQNTGEAKQLRHQVCQVTVHEDEEGLNLTDVVGKTCGEGSGESKQDAKEDAADAHNKEPGDSQEHVRRFNNSHVSEEDKHAVKCLWR